MHHGNIYSAASQPLPDYHYSRGQSALFTRPVALGGAARETLGPIPWDVQVYYFSSSAKSTTERATKHNISPALHSTPTATTKATRSTYLLRKKSSPPCSHGHIYNVTSRRHSPSTTSSHLMVLQGTYSGHPAKVLIDSGASRDFVNAQFVHANNISTSNLPERLQVRLADGSTTTTHLQTCQPLQISNYTETRPLIVTNLDNSDVILGYPWLQQHNPKIDWPTRTISSPFQATAAPYTAPPRVMYVTTNKMHKLLQKKNNQAFLTTLTYHPQSTSTLYTATTSTPPQTADPLRPPTSLPSNLQTQLHGILQRHSETFAEPKGVPQGGIAKHKIQLTPGATPPKSYSRRMSPAELAEAEKQVQTLLDRGWIRPSESPFSANIVFVKKPDGSLRFCVDFRALNNITVKDRYPLPRVDDLLDHLRGATVFTTLDLFSGYHQVAVDPADIYKTAISYLRSV